MNYDNILISIIIGMIAAIPHSIGVWLIWQPLKTTTMIPHGRFTSQVGFALGGVIKIITIIAVVSMYSIVQWWLILSFLFTWYLGGKIAYGFERKLTGSKFFLSQIEIQAKRISEENPQKALEIWNEVVPRWWINIMGEKWERVYKLRVGRYIKSSDISDPLFTREEFNEHHEEFAPNPDKFYQENLMGNDNLEPAEKLKFWARLVAYKLDEYVKIRDKVYKKQSTILSTIKTSLGYPPDFGQFLDEIKPITDTWESLAVKIKLLKEEIESDLTENENKYLTILYEYVIFVKDAVDIFYENQCMFYEASINLIDSNFSFGKFKYRIEQYNSAVENYLEVGKKLNDLNYLIF